ncbi:MAG TPA: phage baseplate assembly protein V [Pyrinomonadaceae bacterium]
MNLYDLIAEGRDEAAARVSGVVVGVVTNNQDPEKMGRVKLRFPWLSDEDESNWARVAVPSAGGGRGFYFLPEVDDEVLVAFEQGDVRFPYVVGSLWNGKDAPPASNEDGKNNVRVIKSRSGHVIRLTDEDGKEMIEVIDKSEKNSIRIDTSKNTITITSDQDIVLSAKQGKITLDAREVEIKSAANTKVEAGANLELKATAQANVKGALVNLN